MGIVVFTVACIVGSLVLLSLISQGTDAPASAGGNVVMERGVQIVTIQAKGGYQPQRSQAKAGVPTTLRFATNGAFDCSSSVRIPSLGISKTLPSTGMTDIDVGQAQPGVLQGTCSMGMYRFDVDFKS